ncbi:Hypothetical protein SRAE_2000448300 [Strongyloides ratti]|uniref:Uncharacterized protein n=1 Tax=Strongyloides ratti TaxID=34506 RepID=A0A090LJ43_STRRB|nr:Hypothetical protein SRAE_2000448300 [Strongyloides ratti]CEF69837.1 Hypothetical protein SRAE_2000448300 [Strongyloides ratti]
MDPLWNGEPPYYTNHTSTYYHHLNIPSVSSSSITTTTTMTQSDEVIVNGIGLVENDLVNIYHENNSNTFNFPRYETIECPYNETTIGYHSSNVERESSTTSNSMGHDNNDLINDPYYYTEHQNSQTGRNVYFNNEENQSYVNNHYDMYNNIDELYNDNGGIRNTQITSPTTILSEGPLNYNSIDDDEPLVSEDQLQDEMDHFENMLNKFSSNDNIIDEDCNDITCDDMLNCFETSIDDNFLKLFDSIESSPEVMSKNCLVSPTNDIFDEEYLDVGGDDEDEKKNKIKGDSTSNISKRKCVTCCKEITKNVFKLPQEWYEKCRNSKTIEIQLFDDSNVKKEISFDYAYKFLKKSPFYIPVVIEKDKEDNSNEKKEEMLRNGFKKLTFKIFILLLKKSEIEAGKERMVRAFVNELERQIFEKFMGKDYCGYKKFARYFMHNQERTEKKILYLNLLRRRMSIGELLKMPLKEVKHGIKIKKENGQSSSSSCSGNLLQEIINDNKVIKNQKRGICTPVKVISSGKIPDSHEGDALSLVDSILGDTNDDTTSKHLNHLYDSNCKICQEKKIKEERLLREREEAVAEREAKRKKREMEIEARIREEKMNLLKKETEEKKKMEKNLCNVILNDGSNDIPLTIYSIKNPDLFMLKDEMPQRFDKINLIRNVNALKEVFEISIESLTDRVMVCIVEANRTFDDGNFFKYRKYLFKERLGIVINFEDSNLLKSFSLIPLDSFADIPDLLFDLPGYEISLFDFSTKFVGVFILEDQKLLNIFTSPPKPPILNNIKLTCTKDNDDKKCFDNDNTIENASKSNDIKAIEKVVHESVKCQKETKDQSSNMCQSDSDNTKDTTSSNDWIPSSKNTSRNETVSSPSCNFKIPSLIMTEPPVPPSIELPSSAKFDKQQQSQGSSSNGSNGGKIGKRKKSRKNRKSKHNKKRNRECSINQNHSKYGGTLNNIRRDFRSPISPYPHNRPDRRQSNNYIRENDDIRKIEDRYNHLQHIQYNESPLYQHHQPLQNPSIGNIYSPRSSNMLPSIQRYSFSTSSTYNSRPVPSLLKQEPYIKPLMEQPIILGPQFNHPSPSNASLFTSRIPQGLSCPQQMFNNHIHGQRPHQNSYYHPPTGNNKQHSYQQAQQLYYNNYSRSRRF